MNSQFFEILNLQNYQREANFNYILIYIKQERPLQILSNLSPRFYYNTLYLLIAEFMSRKRIQKFGEEDYGYNFQKKGFNPSYNEKNYRDLEQQDQSNFPQHSQRRINYATYTNKFLLTNKSNYAPSQKTNMNSISNISDSGRCWTRNLSTTYYNNANKNSIKRVDNFPSLLPQPPINTKTIFSKKQEGKGSNLTKFKVTYKPVSDRYLASFQKINIQQLHLQQQFRNLKKWFFSCQLIKNSSFKINQVRFNKCLNFPVIFFEYDYQKQTRTMHIRDLIRVHQDKHKAIRQVLLVIYDRLYSPVDPQFQDLDVFALDSAKQRHVNHFKKQDMRMYSQSIPPMFYYTIDDKQDISFIIFNPQCMSSQFQTETVRKYGDNHPLQVQLYKRFQRVVKGLQNQQKNDLAQQQKQSDQENEITQNKENIFQIQERLNNLLNKGNSQLQQQVEDKNNQFLQISSKDPQNYKLLALGDQIQFLQTTLQYFNETKQKVKKAIELINQKKISDQDKKLQLKMNIKKMIIASKQLKSKLPILARKKQIFEKLDKQNLIILEGQTGSGKSTQLPQLLCEYFNLFDKLDSKPVLITQPRRLATRSLCDRVKYEIDDQNGCFVDYMASISKKVNPKAKIIFKLDRFLLDELIQSPLLQKYSCLVIDEAHERTISIDVILGLLKELLQKRKDFKIIVTSASMDIQLFQSYFKTKTLKVSGRMHPVSIKYVQSKEIDTTKKIQNVLVNSILDGNSGIKNIYRGHILVFCSEVSQINQLCEIFKSKLNSKVFKVLPLHGKLTPDQQKLVFQSSVQFKLIFASRIAETAITIDGVKVVIDPGFDRQMTYDQKCKISSMKLAQISQSSAKQRMGRAGRTQDGYCFRLYSQEQFKKKNLNKTPQIKNMALDTLTLRLKSLKIKNVFAFSYIQRPNQQGMKTSLQVLKLIGCLNEQQEITKIGMMLVKLQLQPFLARAIVEALLIQFTFKIDENKLHQSGILDSVISILCMVVNASNLFRVPDDSRQAVQFVKFTDFSHEKGDFLFLKFIYDEFIKRSKDKNQVSNLRSWLQNHYLNQKALYQARQLKKQVEMTLKTLKLSKIQFAKDIERCRNFCNSQCQIDNIILGCLSTSFCINLCLYSGNPFVGYTLINKKKPIQIYGTSNLSIQGIYPKWIFTYDLYQNSDGKLFCKIANEVTFQFLKKSVDKYVFKQLELQKAESQNPFYKQIKQNLPSFMFNQVQFDYRLKNIKQELSFLNEFSLTFNDSINQIIFYLPILNKFQSNENEVKLKKYMQKIKKNAQTSYHHNYVGNIFVNLKDGFEIEQIDFSYSETVYEISQLTKQIAQKIKNFAQNNAKIQLNTFDKMKVFIDDPDFNNHFKDFLISLEEKMVKIQLIDYLFNDQKNTQVQKKFKYRQILSDKRKKIPQTKVYLHFFAGKETSSNIFMSYKSENAEDQAQNNLKRLKQAIQVQEIISRRVYGVENFQSKIDAHKLKLTKKGNGINYFQSIFEHNDQYDMRNILQKMKKNNISSFMTKFKMPDLIKKFREFQLPQCLKTNQQWSMKIRQLLSKSGITSQCCINVWGYYLGENKHKSPFQKRIRVDMHAQIRSFDSQIYGKLKQKYDGKKGIIGCQKVHINSLYDQIIAVVFKDVFNNLYDEYFRLCGQFTKQTSSVMFDNFTRIIRGRQKVFIVCKSQNREDLLKPLRVLGNLFSPKTISLSQTQFRFLNSGYYSEGEKLLSQIQFQYEYRIYFYLNKMNCSLKLFCQDNLFEQVSKLLKARLKKLAFFTQKISYRGKNLNILIGFLQQTIRQIQVKSQSNQKFLTYQIFFFKRQINLTADSFTFAKVKEFINQLSNIENAQCKICYGPMDSSYKLYNCSHQFCKFCLSRHIQQTKTALNSSLKCPLEDCKQLININDIKTILNQEEFQKICDIKISKFVQSNQKYMNCITPGCEQIFQKEIVDDLGKIECQLCGKEHCLKCMQSHRNYTCQQWKNQNQGLSKEKLAQYGIKICPNCKTGIMKNQGCNHMTCKCGAHLCWICLKVFEKANQCYSHLTEVHKGVGNEFDYLYER